jgi:hypothetical protein
MGNNSNLQLDWKKRIENELRKSEEEIERDRSTSSYLIQRILGNGEEMLFIRRKSRSRQ